MSSKKDTHITKTTITRIIKDVKDLRKNPLTSHGIFYQHDTDDMLTGRALILGPTDTPYAYGAYFFKIKLPVNYPHEPPKFSFYTNDGKIRMHPNLYKNRKVCLDILNTWYGQAWTGCQSISSVLLTICSILTKNPLNHEPGCGKEHRDYNNYNEVIRYNNIRLSILDILKRKDIKDEFPNLWLDAANNVINNVENIKDYITLSQEIFSENNDKYNMTSNNGDIYTCIYSNQIKVNYSSCLTDFNNLVIYLNDEVKKEN